MTRYHSKPVTKCEIHMRQTFFYSLLALAAVAAFAQPATAEARGRCHGSCRSTSVQLNVGTAYPQRETYVVRRYPHVIPGQVIAPATVIAPGYYGPYYPPAVVYPAPTYVERVYVTPAPRPVGLTGLSFSWNFFK